MKKQELLNLLNESADSISLHDGSLLAFNLENNCLTLIFCIGEYHYGINNLENYVDNLKNSLILTLRFNEVKNIVAVGDDDFEMTDCEILDNAEKDGVYTLALFYSRHYKTISFSYESFLWTDVEELTERQLKKRYKNMGF